MQPIMSDLPKERLSYQSPSFTNTGVDYIVPFYFTVGRNTEERWGFLFICLTTRAVHVEIVTSMDTSSCVMGVERFVSRRGTPAIIWSDNGTNFIEAEKDSEKVLKFGTLSTLQLSSLTKVLSGRSIHPAHHIMVVFGRDWFAVSSACCIYCWHVSPHGWVAAYYILSHGACSQFASFKTRKSAIWTQ